MLRRRSGLQAKFLEFRLQVEFQFIGGSLCISDFLFECRDTWSLTVKCLDFRRMFVKRIDTF